LLEGTGATVTVANNGREALEILSNGPLPPPFDVVLMDLQMPEMDGYQATAKLRSDARFSMLPIIAMTAHATNEERQRCLGSGMNDHISKPIDPANLIETVGRFYRPSSETAPPPVTAVPPRAEVQAHTSDELPSFAGLDTRDGLSRVAGNRKLYSKLLRQFSEQQGAVVGQITAALAQGDRALAERLAHTLKGVAGNIGAKAIHSAAGALEKLIREGADGALVESAKGQVTTVLDPLLAQLQAVSSSTASEGPAEAPPPVAASAAECREAAGRLTTLLSEVDAGVADYIEANRSALRPLFAGETWTQFENLVQGYSFAEAQAQLEEALQRLTRETS